MIRRLILSCMVMSLLFGSVVHAQDRKNMPREDVIDVPAIGKGLCVSNLFQSNMVLQRDKPVAIWGWANPGEKVSVSFAGQSAGATAGSDRSWKVTLKAMPANSSPQAMTVKGKTKTLTLDNILIGDVWVLGGQSNMEFEIAKVENGQLEIVSANFPNIRILTVPYNSGPEVAKGFARLHEWSGWFGRHFRKGDWEACTPQTVRDLSAIGYVFVRRIHKAAQVPIGVIDASRGGTTVETWTPASTLEKIKAKPVQDMLANWKEKMDQWDANEDLQNRIQKHKDWIKRMKEQGQAIPADRSQAPSDLRPGPAKDHNRPGNCYAGMIGPIAGLSVKGALFHQGFNNCFNGTEGAVMYGHVFPKMIAAWRAAFNDPQMPFGILSLCTAGHPQNRDNYLENMTDVGAYIREAQYKTFLDLYNAGDKNIGFVSTYDLRRRWYHPQLKVPAGERIARWALATQYGMSRDLSWKPPFLKSIKAEDGKLILQLDSQVQNPMDGPIEGFAIAGEDMRFQPAEVDYFLKGKDSRGRPQYDRSILVLTSPLVKKPVHFRYAWARNPMGNLQLAGLKDVPFATQRSDDWSMEAVYLALSGECNLPEGKLDRGQRGKLIKILRDEDTKRRLHEAQTLIDQNKQ